MIDAVQSGVKQSITLNCYAKINLTLDVEHPREDGLHPLRSIMQTVELHDSLHIDRQVDRGMRFSVSGPESKGIPMDSTNLVVKAISLMDQTFDLDIARNGISVELTKNIPSQAGLGGGSSNAAATLLAICRLFAIPAKVAELTTLARTLGSDVPFFLTGGTALVEGTGEACHQIKTAFAPYPVLIAKGKYGISTAEAYKALDSDPGRKPGSSTSLFLSALESTSMPQFHNDFHEIISAIEPDVMRTITLFGEASTSDDYGPALLSGSGASVFKIYKERVDAEKDANILRSAGLSVYLTSLKNA